MSNDRPVDTSPLFGRLSRGSTVVYGNEVVPGERLRAAQAAADRADREASASWQSDAAAFLLAYAGTVDSFLVEDAVRRWDEAKLPAPPDSRAWGAVVRRLAVAGKLVPYGVGRDAFGSYKSRWRAASP